MKLNSKLTFFFFFFYNCHLYKFCLDTFNIGFLTGMCMSVHAW